jgi:hypothetical protein
MDLLRAFVDFAQAVPKLQNLLHAKQKCDIFSRKHPTMAKGLPATRKIYFIFCLLLPHFLAAVRRLMD